MAASGEFWDTVYDACCWSGARCKRQLLRHNVAEINQWPPTLCHHTHDPGEWTPYLVDGQMYNPSREESRRRWHSR